MADEPRVFVSYSHDSDEHKEWVAGLSTKLCTAGVDAVLDRWELVFGRDVAKFMVEGISDADRVLIVCTPDYVTRANEGKGGAGYETTIVTAELVQDAASAKFIPVIRKKSSGDQHVPKFLGSRCYADFSDDSKFDVEFEKLARVLHGLTPEERPALGHNPYADDVGPGAGPENQSENSLPIPAEVGTPEECYQLCVDLVRRNDLLGWRQLVKNARRRLDEMPALARELSQSVQDDDEWRGKAVDTAVDCVSHLIVISLVGLESRDPKYDYHRLLDDLLGVEWQSGGPTIVVELPQSLAFVYQALHGALAVNTGQLSLATDLAAALMASSDGQTQSWLWQSVFGWPRTLGGCRKGWDYLSGIGERWEWLQLLFGRAADYLDALTAYYMSLTVNELAVFLAKGGRKYFDADRRVTPEVPPCYLLQEHASIHRAATLLKGQADFSDLWERAGVPRDQMASYWPAWVKSCFEWLNPHRFVPWSHIHAFEHLLD